MKFQLRHQISLVIGIIIAVVDFMVFFHSGFFVPILFVALTIAWMQFWIDYFQEIQRQKEIEERFPEFVRNLTSSIKSGMPISRAIIYVGTADYGTLTPHIKKLAHQVEWAIPIHKALDTLSEDTENPVIKRAIATVIEAEKSGGNIEDVLESVTASLISIKKIKLERKAAIHSQMMQSYIIYIIFIGVMVIIQNVLVPYITNMQGVSFGGEVQTLETQATSTLLDKVSIDLSTPRTLITSLGAWLSSFYGVFLMLSIIQGLFTGLVIGKLSEGELRSGAKHSLILVSIAILVISIAQKFI